MGFFLNLTRFLPSLSFVPVPFVSCNGLHSGVAHNSGTAACTQSDDENSEYANAKRKVCDAYKEQVTCASCHADVHPPPGHGFMAQ